MVEPTKTKTHKGIMENSWIRDVLAPLLLILPAILILEWVWTSNLPSPFKQFILASSALVAAALILEIMIIISKLMDLLIDRMFKISRKLL